MKTSNYPSRRLSPKQCLCLGTAFLLVLSGCGQVAPNKTTTGAGTGAAVGALGGAAVGANSSMGTGVGALGGAAAGALIGGAIGMIQDARDRKEQDSLAQQRAYQIELAKKKTEEARIKAAMDDELDIQKGFRISDLELNDTRKRAEETAARLKRSEEERAAAMARTKELRELQEKILADEAKAAALEEEIARLKGDGLLNSASISPTPAGAAPAVPDAPNTR
jgi:hypothetical protein